MKSQFDDHWKQMVHGGALKLGMTLDPLQLDMMARHACELVKWNRTFNITAITEPADMAVKHFIDSAAIVSFVPDNASIIDIGSGGGFPGVVLKIVKPGTNVVMVDASRKKISFLKHIIRKFKMEGIDAVHGRVEHIGEDRAFKQNFDIAVSRAFSSLKKFSLMAHPFLSKTGIILAMKGRPDPEEIQSISKKQFQIKIDTYLLPYQNHERSIITLKPII